MRAVKAHEGLETLRFEIRTPERLQALLYVRGARVQNWHLSQFLEEIVEFIIRG